MLGSSPWARAWGLFPPSTWVRFAGCRNQAGNLALRITLLKTKGPRGSGDVLRSCSGSYLPPHHRWYCQDSTSSLSWCRASTVAWASTLAPTRSRTDGALAPPYGLGGAGPCTDGALSGGGRALGHLARQSWCCDAELSVFCTMACCRSPRSP